MSNMGVKFPGTNVNATLEWPLINENRISNRGSAYLRALLQTFIQLVDAEVGLSHERRLASVKLRQGRCVKRINVHVDTTVAAIGDAAAIVWITHLAGSTLVANSMQCLGMLITPV